MADLAESAARGILELGVVGALLLLIVAGIIYFARWSANRVVVPLVDHMIKYLGAQQEYTQRSTEILEDLSAMEKELRTTIEEIDVRVDRMEQQHIDNDSRFATVHTNEAIRIVASAIQRIAKKLGVDIDDLVRRIEEVLAQQKTR